ncbi:MAG TPA: tubulin-like doman-containing protein, partial [Planctomycetota bacterium]|nr:tubulin-like doman-containing protein [Planctomycetota bacterium]
MDLGSVVRDFDARPELHPHLDWLEGLRLDSSFADFGCQGIPRLGRLVFVELRSMIHEAVKARFSDLRTSTQKVIANDRNEFVVAPDGAPAVHVCSSICGGTGAGLLIDMAYNLRWWSRESFPRRAEIIGHLMLPEAFPVDPRLRLKLEAVAAATLEEIEFLTDSRRSDIPVQYKEERRAFDRLTAPFNFLYLLSGQGDTGSGNRKHLAQMIARAVRAMVLEPMGYHVSADANNKLNDVLGLLDPANGRRRCFASYGYWYGTPGHQHQDVDRWIASGLEAMAAVTSESESHRNEIQTELQRHLDVSPIAAGVEAPSRPYEWDNVMQALATSSAARVEQSIRQSIRAYFHETLESEARAKADAIRHRGQPIPELLDAANRMIEEDLCGTKLAPLSQVATTLAEWIEEMSSQLESLRARSASQTLQNVAALISRDVQRGLADQLRDLGGLDALSLTPEMVKPIVNNAVERHWPAIVEIALRENLVDALKLTLHVLHLREQSLQTLPSLTTVVQSSGTRNAIAPAAASNQDFFSTPLYSATDPTNDTSSAVARQFRQKLVRPILRRLVLDIESPNAREADVDVLSEELQETLRELAPEADALLEAAERDDYDTFHRDIDGEVEVSLHKYFAPICDIIRLGSPKIDLDRTGVYKEPLDVGIAQHMENVCVSGLLQRSNVGATFREAHVTADFEKETDSWFQLLQLRYGFNLEAISTYHTYIDATRGYIEARGFRFEDLWLHRQWYREYQSAREKWLRNRAAAINGDGFEKGQYDSWVAHVHDLGEQARDRIAGIERRLREGNGSIDIGVALEVGAALRSARDEITRRIDAVLSRASSDGSDQTASWCTGRVQELERELTERFPQLRPLFELVEVDGNGNGHGNGNGW